jgi:hypothetical protein
MRASVHLCTNMSNYIHDCIRSGRRCSHNRTIIDTLPHLAKQKTHTHIVETYANKKWCTNLNNPSARTSTPKLTNEVLLPHFNACPSFLSQGATSKRRISISVTSVRSCSLSHGCPSKNFRVHHHFPHQIDELKSKKQHFMVLGASTTHFTPRTNSNIQNQLVPWRAWPSTCAARLDLSPAKFLPEFLFSLLQMVICI